MGPRLAPEGRTLQRMKDKAKIRAKRPTERLKTATEIVPPANRLILILHAMPGNDGGEGIIRYLSRKYEALALNGAWVGRRPLKQLIGVSGKTFIAEYPFPFTAARAVYELAIPPQFVTHVLLLLPGSEGMTEITETLEIHLDRLMFENQPTALALGDVHRWNAASMGIRTYEELPEDARRLINYIETRFERTVLYVGTGPSHVIDREPLRDREK